MSKTRCEMRNCDAVPVVEIVGEIESFWTCATHEAPMTEILLEERFTIVEIADRPLHGLEYRK